MRPVVSVRWGDATESHANTGHNVLLKRALMERVLQMPAPIQINLIRTDVRESPAIMTASVGLGYATQIFAQVVEIAIQAQFPITGAMESHAY